MLGNLYKHPLFSPKTYVALEIVYDSRTDYRINLHEVTRTKKAEFKVTCLLENTTLDEAINTLGSQKYMGLTIRGKILLQDTIQLDTDIKDPLAFNLEEHFSFGQVDDYVISTYFTAHTCQLKAVRQEIVKTWVTQINKQKIEVYNLSLGIDSLANYFKGIDLKPGYYSWENEILNWDGEAIEGRSDDVDSSPLMPNLQSEETQNIESLGLIALSNGISHYYKFANPKLSFEDKLLNLSHQEEGYYISNFIKKIALVVLPILFVSLLINFFVFTQYSKDSNALHETLSTNEFKWKIYEDLKQRFENNKQVLTRHSRLGSMTYYADQVAHLRPYQVKFSKVDIFPITEKGLEYTIEENTMYIQGNSSNHSQYQAWIKLLNKTDWITTLETLKYKRDVESGLTHFTLKIEIGHE